MAATMEPGTDGAPDLDGAEAGDLDLDSEAGEFELPGPEPTMDRDPEAFQVASAGEAGPLPPDVDQELRRLSEALQTQLDDPEGMIATRFGRRVVVAPVDQPDQAVDVADVDMPRHLVLTFGGEDPTPQGSVLAQVLFQRRELAHGFVHAPDVKGPTFSVMQRVLPSLRAAGAVEVEDVGTLAVGHGPAEIAGALEGLRERQEEEAANADDEDAVDGDPDVNRV
jgi:hypothetical protein